MFAFPAPAVGLGVVLLFEVFCSEIHTQQHFNPIIIRIGRSFLDPGLQMIENPAIPYLVESAVT